MTDAQIAREWIAEISVDEGLVVPERGSEVAFKIDDLIFNDPERAWSIIKLISQSRMSTWAEENFSAGPLSSLIFHHQTRFARRILTLSREQANFRDQLLGVVFQDMVAAILSGADAQASTGWS